MTNMQGKWPNFQNSVGAFAGTSTEIYRPGIESQYAALLFLAQTQHAAVALTQKSAFFTQIFYK